jgi:hypothetical protein
MFRQPPPLAAFLDWPTTVRPMAEEPATSTLAEQPGWMQHSFLTRPHDAFYSNMHVC